MIGQTVSHYRILEKLGEGGMGVVYKAEDTRLQRPVALKFLTADLVADEAAHRRFIHEARAASALDHPNIAIVHEIDESADGRSFICMAYYPGETLKDRIARGPLAVEETVGIAAQIADGLERAHGAGITHRDIKPANILITPDGVVKILDFGLAKLTGEAKSGSTGARAGTAPYMSPEQIRGSPVDQRTDLFSLGIILYEMLSGQRPFEGEHEAALFYTLLNTDPIPLSVRRLGVPPAVETLVNRLLKKNPQERFQTAAELRIALRSISSAADRPALEQKELSQRLPDRRRGALAGGLIALGAIGLAIVGWLSWPWFPSTGGPGLSIRATDYLMVADFDNETDNSVFDNAITEAVKISLWQSSHFNILPADRIQAALTRMRAGGSSRLDEPAALEIAKREGARIVVAGGIGPATRGYVLTAKIIDAAKGDIISLPRREFVRVEDVLPELDALCEEIREVLGEPLQEISKNALPLRRVTTPSLDALEFYSRGEKSEQQGNYRDAAAFKEKAVALDSTFTMAVSDLSYIHRKLGNDSAAVTYHQRVLPLIDRVTDRERFYILTTYYGPSFEFDFGKTYEAAREMVSRFPNDAEAHGQFGYLGMYFCDLANSIAENERAMQMDSTYAGILYNNSGYAAGMAGDGTAALGYFQRSKDLRPGYYGIDSYMAHAYWMMGGLISAETTLINILRGGDLRRRFLTHQQLGALYLAQGRLVDLGTEIDSGIILSGQGTPPYPTAYLHYLAGERAAVSGDRKAFQAEMKAAEETVRPPYTELVLVAVGYLRQGDRKAAERIRKRIAGTVSTDPFFNRRKSDFLHLVDGAILLAPKKPSQAVPASQAAKEFEAVEKVHCGDPLYYTALHLRAEATELRSRAEAIQIYSKFLSDSGEVVLGALLSYPATGSYTGGMIPHVRVRLAELHLGRKDRTSARAHLDAAMNYWAGADPEFIPAQRARLMLSRLSKEPGRK